MEAGRREIVVVMAVALLGVLLAALVVLAPWHPAEATQVPVKVFAPASAGQS